VNLSRSASSTLVRASRESKSKTESFLYLQAKLTVLASDCRFANRSWRPMAAVYGWIQLRMERQSALRYRSQRSPSMPDLIHLALIDDDEAVLDALRHYLTRHNIETCCFKAAKDFLTALDQRQQFDCIVSDVRMPQMSGLELAQRLNERSYAKPVVLITGHGDVDMAVTAIRSGAFDFIEKPFDEARLLASIRRAVAEGRRSENAAAELEQLHLRFNTLSPRQRQVMELAAAGLSSKEIGIRLLISPKTVEIHRSWMMERMGARNLADLIRMAIKIQVHNERLP
jgi:two-component system response regulator FixJ